MKLDDLKEVQMKEILSWSGELDTILTPDNLVPSNIKEFPSFMETSERLKRICKYKAEELKEQSQLIKDIIMDAIEQQEYVFKLNGGGMPVIKKKFNTADKRNRELRVRLASHSEYNRLKNEEFQWSMLYSDWISHVNRLRRELRILEVNYQSAGGDGMNI